MRYRYLHCTKVAANVKRGGTLIQVLSLRHPETFRKTNNILVNSGDKNLFHKNFCCLNFQLNHMTNRSGITLHKYVFIIIKEAQIESVLLRCSS